jgi:hypothetical protein
MERYDMALIITVDAENYEDAQQITDNIAAGLGDTEQIACSAAPYEHDNDGQRVVYLHPEDFLSEN